MSKDLGREGILTIGWKARADFKAGSAIHAWQNLIRVISPNLILKGANGTYRDTGPATGTSISLPDIFLKFPNWGKQRLGVPLLRMCI